MAKYQNKTFTGETVVLDGNEFDACVFERCTLQYHGLRPVVLTGNTVNDCQWSFSGPAANAVQFMTALYRSGPQGALVIEQTFNAIRGLLGSFPPDSVPVVEPARTVGTQAMAQAPLPAAALQ